MIILLVAEKACLQNPILPHDKIPGEIKDTTEILQCNKNSLQQVLANINLNDGKLKALP